jgi:hypothetical protein
MADRKSIQSDLQERGVASGFSEALAERLDRVADRLHPEIYDAVLTGATLAYGEHRRSLDALEGSAHDLDEIQTLLKAFGEELAKLDEALETLAAYTLRMRTQSVPSGRLLH